MQKCLVISGGSKGIGLATALFFQQRGYQVINLSRSAAPCDGVVNLEVDFASPGWEGEIEPQLMELVTSKDEIVLVHNAAFLSKGGVGDLDPWSLRASFEINVVAPSILNRMLLPIMKEHSSIVYIGSTLSEKAVANTAAYVASKHAVVGLMRSTCQDLVGTAIHTCCVCPGFTDTDMLTSHVGGREAVESLVNRTVTQKRLIRPEEMADMIYLCSQNALINGSVIHANLGQVEH